MGHVGQIGRIAMKRIFSFLAAIALTCIGVPAQDVVYCRGELVGAEDWSQNKLYPLTKNADGIFEGTVKVVECSQFEGSPVWGNRACLFFNLNNSWTTYVCEGIDRFVTPARTESIRLAKSGDANKVFQCLGGEYRVRLNLENMIVNFEPVNPVWLDYVVVSGSLEGEIWGRPGGKYKLMHQGNGIYKGIIKVEDSGNGLGNLAIFASNLKPEESWTEGRYNCTGNVRTFPGVVESVGRYNGDHSIALVPDEYIVTFDMNAGTVRFNLPSDPDLITTRVRSELALALEEASQEWEGVDFSALWDICNDVNSTDEMLEEAIKQIPVLIHQHKKELVESEGSVQSPADATLFMENTGYATSGRDGWSGSSVEFEAGAMYAQDRDFNHYQTLADIPNGVYRISLKGTSLNGSGEACYSKPGRLSLTGRRVILYATSGGNTSYCHFCDVYDRQYDALKVEGEADPSGEGWYIPLTPSAAQAYMENGRYADNELYAYVSDGKLQVGLKLANHGHGSLTVCDDWTLEFLGNQDESYEALVSVLQEQLDNLCDEPAEACAVQALQQALAESANVTEEARADNYALLTKLWADLDASMTEYASFRDAAEAALESLDRQYSDLQGSSVDLYREYLSEYAAPGRFPNGSVQYILENGSLSGGQLQAEAEYMQRLLSQAIHDGLVPGTDVTSLLSNTDFSQPDFYGWDFGKEGNGTCYGKAGLEGFPVAGCQGMDSFKVTQTCAGLPNGIYSLTFNGLCRTGKPESANADDDMPAFALVGNIHTPMVNAVSGAIGEDEAQEGVNCRMDDYVADGMRYPGSPEGCSVAFKAGRYAQTAYGIVDDGVLTVGVEQKPFPAYDGEMLAFGGMTVRYLGTSDEAATAMLDAMVARGELLAMSVYYFSETARTALLGALEMPEDSYAERVDKARALDSACDDVLYSASCYSQLEKNTIAMFDRISAAGDHVPQDVAATYTSLYNTILDKLSCGAYEDGEAIAQAEECRLLAERFTPIMAKGGLQKVQNGCDNDVYLLYPNEDGVYEGDISFIDSDDLSATNPWWGSRSDLFFKDAKGVEWSCGRPSDRFITPALRQPVPLTVGFSSVFQANGGDYHVWLDYEKKEVRFECTREFYMDSVYCVGTLAGQQWQWNDFDYSHSLRHVGSGIYKGVVSVDAAPGKELGEFSIRAAYGCEGGVGRYGSYVNRQLNVGEVTQAVRTNSATSKWYVEPGTWHVTFDMNNSTVRLNTVDNPDYVANDGEDVDNSIPIYCLGGLQDVGNWEDTDRYPLHKNKDGIYEGEVTISDLATVPWNGNQDDSRWGARNDLFFKDAIGMYYGASASLSVDDRFITPGRGYARPLGRGYDKVFQAHAGTYKVRLDLDRMEVSFECVEEKWTDEIYVGGSVVGNRWYDGVAPDRSNVLRHVGDGLYQGVVQIEEDNGMTGSFYIETAMNSGAEGRYTTLTNQELCPTDGSAINLYRTNDQAVSMAVRPGTWLVSFDWSHGFVQLCNPDDADAIKEIGVENASRTLPVGIYTLDGKKVYSGHGMWNTASPGIYIQVTADSVKKVLVR